jgi:16S rRNA (cytosine967-C5)-methyltransferase
LAEQKKTDVRALAHSALMMINEENSLSHIIVREALDKYDYLDGRDKALFYRLVNGTLEYQNTLDSVIDEFSKVKVSKMKPYVRNLVRMGLYQILYMDKVPDSAACNESVNMIKKSALRNLSGFVNGLLRNVSRNKDSIKLESRERRYSVKKWMLEELDASIGTEAADAFLADSLKERAVYVRVSRKSASQELIADNTQESTADVSQGATANASHEPTADAGCHPITVAGITITDMYRSQDPDSITDTAQWQRGEAYIQDISSTMPVRLSGIAGNMTVIDVCAAPGGKAVQAAQRMNGTGRVIACDISEKKVQLIRDNAARTGCSNIEARVCDATEFHEEYEALADVVIADLPCSGIGTISHKPDIKNRLSHGDVEALADIQQRILGNVCRYVKPGGQLVFSTCTLTHEENADNAAAFVKDHPEFVIKQSVTMLPCEAYSCDGFYICVMDRSR